MLEVVFIGTAGAIPSRERSLPATLVRHGSMKFLVDCGDGTVRQLTSRSSIPGLGKALTEPFMVLITHEHADHLLGVGTLIYYLDMTTNTKKLKVLAPPTAARRVRALLRMMNPQSDLRVSVKSIVPGVVYEDESIRCKAFSTRHTPESLGFVFDQKSSRPFLPQAADKLGVPKPLRKILASGQPVTLDDSRVVHPDEVMGSVGEGVRLVITGDTPFTRELVGACHGANLLVAEAPYLEADRALAVERGHLTAAQAGQLAADAEVHTLCLHHLSERYDEHEVLAEAKMQFEATYIAADYSYAKVQEDGTEII